MEKPKEIKRNGVVGIDQACSAALSYLSVRTPGGNLVYLFGYQKDTLLLVASQPRSILKTAE
jgi:hypothetical protein